MENEIGNFFTPPTGLNGENYWGVSKAGGNKGEMMRAGRGGWLTEPSVYFKISECFCTTLPLSLVILLSVEGGEICQPDY